MIEENENLKNWEGSIFNAIKDVADIDSQKKTWLGKDPHYISSFSEVINILYDDFDFEQYVKYYEQVKGKDALYILFSELDEKINEYDASGKTDEQILEDPPWIEITQKAKEISRMLDNRTSLLSS
ncbi:hypothetical protein ACFSJU_07655 [Paradesertivirga mongoliensis]|uniref:Uncharacterized protein n=1 Tax=Paradesertivirga mongoliensis TaxID=2100740 RepID=A0ABW4ZKW8_9SPHI|nr:hypothetical protein [Pedobacter mongoliensis]